ncbi:MAG: Gas vesicle protein [Ferruginibacter sp.]|nr:Gas vesicle protein [Ferruginibacter sp.]
MTTVNKLMIGMAVGAIFGVLYAPDRGSNTRRKLARTGEDIRDAFNEFTNAISDKIDQFKENADDAAEDAMIYEEMAILENDMNTSGRTGESWQTGN